MYPFLLGLPRTTHCNLLHQICQDIPVHNQICIRFIKFFNAAINSSNSVIKLCASLALNGSGSSISNSLSHISHKNRTARHDLINSFSALRYNNVLFNSETSLIIDLLIMRHVISSPCHVYYENSLTFYEISFALNVLCTS